MSQAVKRGGARAGAGRKPKDKAGELMKPHAMRWTDAGWADVLLVGMDRVRELVAKEAAKLRKQQSSEQPHAAQRSSQPARGGRRPERVRVERLG